MHIESHYNLPIAFQTFWWDSRISLNPLIFFPFGLTCCCRGIFLRAASGSLCTAIHCSSWHSSAGEVKLMAALQTLVEGGQ